MIHNQRSAVTLMNDLLRVALLDWDNTLRPGFTLTDWVHFLDSRKHFDHPIAYEIYALMDSYSEGTAAYSEIAQKAPYLYARGLRGREVDTIHKNAREFIEVDRDRLFGFTWPFLSLLKERNIGIRIVSGCPDEVLNAYVTLLGQGKVYGLSAEHIDGVYTGNIAANHASTDGKKKAAAEIADRGPIFLAVGDSESDLPLFEKAVTRLVFGNSELLPSDDDTWHVDPFGPASEIADFLGNLISQRSRQFDERS